MTNLPIPFVVAFLLVLLAMTNHHAMKATATGRVFLQMIYLHALSMVIIGLRWSLDMVFLLPAAAVLAVVTSAMLYLAFCSLGRVGPVISPRRDWPHAVPVVLVAICSFVFLNGVDILLALTKLVYAFLLARLARRAPDSLQFVRLSWLKNTHKSLWGAAGLLLFSLVLDVGIALDFALYDGRHAEFLVGGVSFIALLLLGWVSVQAGRQRVLDVQQEFPDSVTPTNEHEDSSSVKPNTSTSSAASELSDSENEALLLELNRLLVEERLFADTELNLQKLARKASVPARHVSRAVNASTGQNISQWVNAARIDAVCDRLSDKSVSISDAMFECGFLTKSNFNREFRRTKGCSPSEWRNRESS